MTSGLGGQRRRHAGGLGPRLVEDWRPEDPVFWKEQGRAIAYRNLCLSIPPLLLSFAVWVMWSVVVAWLPAVGFSFSTDELFWLASLPGLSGPALRAVYSFMPPIFGGRLWTALTTWSLLIPALGIGLAVQHPQTPYSVFVALALLCGLGGGNFASSMANISFFFPRSIKGHALALNAGFGNLGVSVSQFVIPLAITAGVFGWLGGPPQTVATGTGAREIWLQNAGFIWTPFIALSGLLAWFGMNDIAVMKASLVEQAVIFRRKQTWLMGWLYAGTFGSFIGYSAGFPLLAQTQFPEVNALPLAFIGPLIGALSRSGTGWISDRYGGGRVTFWAFVAMITGVLGVLCFLSLKTAPGAFWGFFASFLLLFLASGIGNASTFQMIPAIMRQQMRLLEPQLSTAEQAREAEKESAAIIGFSSAVAAFGAFFIPHAFGQSIRFTGGAEAALALFLLFYGSCIAITWGFYTRRGALLYELERSAAPIMRARD